MARVLVSAIAVSLASLVVGMTSVSAASPAEPVAQRATDTVTVPTQRVVSIERDPRAPADRCNTIVFYQWDDVPGTLSATVTWTNPSKGQQSSATASAPFSDVETGYVPTRYAPSGTHWINVGFGSAAGTGAGGRCEENRPVYDAGYSPTGTALLTVEGAAEPPIDIEKCKEARADLKARNKAVGKLLGKLKKASSDSAKDRLRELLAEAKIKRAKAVKKVSKACT